MQRLQHAMLKWMGSYKPAILNAGFQALVPTKGGLAVPLLDTHTLLVEMKEIPAGSERFEVISATVKPLEHLKRCLAPGIYDHLMQHIRSSGHTQKEVVGWMVTCVQCWTEDGRESKVSVTPTPLSAEEMEELAGKPFDPDWERTFKGCQDYKWFIDPDGEFRAIPVERVGKGRKRRKETQ